MQRNYTTVGADYTDTPHKKKSLAAAIDALEWREAKGPIPMMQGLAIKAAVEEFKIPKVTQAAVHGSFRGLGLLGIEAHYSNGRARIYLLDRGSDALVLASDFFPAE